MSVLNPLHQGTNAGASSGSSFSAMFGGEKPSTAQAIQTKLSSAATQVAAGEVPTFTEESAFNKCFPNLTYKQVPNPTLRFVSISRSRAVSLNAY